VGNRPSLLRAQLIGAGAPAFQATSPTKRYCRRIALGGARVGRLLSLTAGSR
jgi:hypothetical protein